MSQNPNLLNELSRKKGIKLLMTLKNAQNIYNEYSGSSIEDYYNFMEKNDDLIKEFKEEIENEEKEINSKNNQADIIEEKSQEMLSDVDSMLQEIKELKSKINDFKIYNKIKTKRDYLKYMNLVNLQTESNNKNNKNEMAKSQAMFYNKIEKDFKNKNEEIEKLSEYKKYIIPKENEKDKDYKDIKEKLEKQAEQIKKFENEKNYENIDVNNNNINNINLNEDDDNVNDNIINENMDNNYSGTGDKDVDKLLNEIKMADLQMDSYLKDIDECIEMNENIEKKLNNNENEEENDDDEKNK